MTISSTNRKAGPYIGTGLVSAFPFAFKVFAAPDVLAVLADSAGTEAALTLNTDYTVALNTDQNANPGGTIALPAALAEGFTLTLTSSLPYLQQTDLTNAGGFYPRVLTDVFDRLTVFVQQLAESVGRSLKTAISTPNGFNATLPAPVPYKVIGWNATGTGFTNTDPSGTSALAADLASGAPTKGAWLVAFKSLLSGSALRPVGAKLSDVLTVEDFGATGDGTANDSPAFSLMLAATGGVLRLLDKPYRVGVLNITAYPKVVIVGARMPKPTADLGQLYEGTILIGQISIEANDVHLERWGLDRSASRSVTTTDGLVVNAKPGQVGNRATLKDVSSLGVSDTDTTHGILVQGYEHADLDTIYSGRQQFGAVVKCRNARITSADFDEIRTAGVYFKSDLSAYAGGVADGSASSMAADDVQLRAKIGNTDACAVYIHASTVSIQKCQVTNVQQVRGLAPVRIQGSATISDPNVSAVQVENVTGDKTQTGVYFGGYVYDTQVSNILAINPATGKVVQMDTNIYGWQINGAHVLISDSGITSAVCAELYGTGAWDNFSVRNPYRPMSINVAGGSLPSIVAGKTSGDCYVANEGALAGLNGSVVDGAALSILPGSVLKLSGRFDLTASSNKAFCNLPINTGKQMVFACGGIASAGAYASFTVRLNDFQLSVEPSMAGTQRIDLSGITIPL